MPEHLFVCSVLAKYKNSPVNSQFSGISESFRNKKPLLAMSNLRQPRHREATSTASGRSDRECGASIDNIDHTSLRSATRSRRLARLDRLLRRWLPGYNYLRGPIAPIDSSSSHSHSRPSADILEAGRSTSRLQQRQDSVTAEVRASSLPMQKRKDGEVVLDAGIAKSEFCMKLEKLLRAKLIVKE